MMLPLGKWISKMLLRMQSRNMQESAGLFFYINKEMSVSKRPHTQKPIYQENIETHGESLGITVEWRGPSHIEQILLALPTVRDLYFNPMPGLFPVG